MKILAFDTSSANFSLALTCDDKIKENDFQLGSNLSEQIVPVIKDFLRGNKTTLQDLDGVAVGIGPGSFTGLRIGLSIAKALTLASGKPLIGIPSLDCLAVNALNYAHKIVSIVDAKREKVYAAKYTVKKGNLKRESGYLLVGIDGLLKKVSGEVWFLGDGVGLYKERIKKALGKRANFAMEGQWFPKAANLVKLAQTRLAARKFDDPYKIVPIYLYPPECQVRLKK